MPILEVRDDENTWNSKTEQMTITTAGRTEYYITDHLGSIRTTIDGTTGAVLGYDDYYPFGLAMPGRSSNTGTPNDLNKFTGHERDTEGNLNLDYMLARNYDPEIGRFLSIDPLYNKRSWLSPYNYVQNNPLIRIDPTGMIDDYILYKDSGEITLLQKTNSDEDVLFAQTESGDVDISNSISIKKNENGGSVISDLSKKGNLGKYEYNDVVYDVTGSENNSAQDSYNVFKFAASNSSVEWSFQSFSDKTASVSTSHDDSFVATVSLLNKNKTVKYDIHSHPSNTYHDLRASDNDKVRAEYFKKLNPNARTFIYMPKVNKTVELKVYD